MRPVVVFMLMCISAACIGIQIENYTNHDVSHHRKSRFWGIGIVRFANSVCTGHDGTQGTCYTKRQCHDIGGVPTGRCAGKIGVCCVVHQSCGGYSSYNNTYFANRHFPTTVSAPSACTFTIKKCGPEICQVRIDFLNFNLAQPDGNGTCCIDSFNVFGGASSVPPICGDNSGSHMYVDFNGAEPIKLLMQIGAKSAVSRSWKFKIAQIDCECPTRAPSGCYQYYTALSGTVRSINYGQTASSYTDALTGAVGTRQIANMNYGICVAMTPGYCSITWSPASGDLFAFTVTNNTVNATRDGTLGTPAVYQNGTNCTTDFVVIPNGSVNGIPTGVDRYCGNGLPTITIIGWWGIGVVRFENKFCTTPEGLDGTCYTRRQCRELDGTSSGFCAGNIGRCCTLQRGCGSSSSNNNTYFVNKNYPGTITGTGVCTYVIQKCNPDICQVRLDFLSFNLAHPNGIGQCLYDSMKITGADSIITPICGDNSGHHMYLSFRGNSDITITIVTTNYNDLARSWYLKVAQIGCDSPSRAPGGCLQYFADTSGTVTSFNYGRTRSGSNIAPNQPGTRELANQEYGICVRAAPGYCSIKWEATIPGSFAVSGNSSAMEEETDCQNDYVIIPNGINGTGIKVDRYCGSAFATVTSIAKPFVLYYITDSTEMLSETGNLGFSLDYTQIRCNPLVS